MDTIWRDAAAECTVSQYLPRAVQLCPSASRDTYNAGFVRLADAHGASRLADITPADLELLRDETRRTVGERRVAAALARGRRLRSYDPDAHGKGAAENLVRSVRRFFRCAVRDRLLPASPASELQAPARPVPPERALTGSELEDLYRVAGTTGNDPELDVRLVTFLRHTACRREGVVNATVDALDRDRRSVNVTEKGGRVRELPLSSRLIADLHAFARSRGARAGCDSLFRFRDGHPLTYRRFDGLFNRLDRNTTWAEPLDVGAHWIRHTTLSDIAAVAGRDVTASYAGHQTRLSKDPTLRYVTVTMDDLRAAYERVFGC